MVTNQEGGAAGPGPGPTVNRRLRQLSARATPGRLLSPPVHTHMLRASSEQPANYGAAAGGASRRVARKRAEAPRFYAAPHDRTVEEGESVTLKCSVAGTPSPQAVWERDNIPIRNSEKYRVTEAGDERLLLIRQVRRADAGLYRVSLQNEAGRMQATARLSVLGKHRPSSDRLRSSVERGSGSGRPHGSAGAGGRGSRAQSGGSSASELFSHPAAGVWFCDAEVIPGSAPVRLGSPPAAGGGRRGSAPADRAAPPVFVVPLQDSTAIEGQSKRLSVTVSGAPPIRVSWTRHRAAVRHCADFRLETAAGGHHALLLSDVYAADQGPYGCHASNAHGRASSHCRLTVVEDASTPGAVSASDRQTTTVVSPTAREVAAPAVDSPSCREVAAPAGAALRLWVRAAGVAAVSWSVNGRSVAARRARIQINTTAEAHCLEISRLEPSDTGSVEVSVRGAAGSWRNKVALVVRPAAEKVAAPASAVKASNSQKVLSPALRKNPGGKVLHKPEFVPEQAKCLCRDKNVDIDTKSVVANASVTFREPVASQSSTSSESLVSEATSSAVSESSSPKCVSDAEAKSAERQDSGVVNDSLGSLEEENSSEEVANALLQPPASAGVPAPNSITDTSNAAPNCHSDTSNAASNLYTDTSTAASNCHIDVSNAAPNCNTDASNAAPNCHSDTSNAASSCHADTPNAGSASTSAAAAARRPSGEARGPRERRGSRRPPDELCIGDSDATSTDASSGGTAPPSPSERFLILEGPASLSVLLGQTARLECRLSDGGMQPTPAVVWSKAGRRLEPSDRVTIEASAGLSALTLRQVSADDSGKYVVRAGDDECWASLAVEGPPEPPCGAPNVARISHTSATLSWCGPAFDGGSMVTEYQVEARAADATWRLLVDHCRSTSAVVDVSQLAQPPTFRVRAVNKHGRSGAGAEATAPPYRPGADSPHAQVLQEERDAGSGFEHRQVALAADADFSATYETQEELGKGRFGTVHKVMERSTGRHFAAKFIKCIKAADRGKVLEEIAIMNELAHPKLLQLAAAIDQGRQMIMILEYVSGGELFERVVADDFMLTEHDCILFMQQICSGVQHMHQLHIMHLDMKPENILCLTKTTHLVKIIDFGLARRYREDTPTRVMLGTPEFIAPEIISYEPISPRSDMWSLGVICYILLSGLSPFMGDSDAETFANITRSAYDFDDEAFDAVSEAAKDFITCLLQNRQTERLSASAALQHTWLSHSQTKARANVISTEKLKKFIIRRKWQKTGNAIRALGRMSASLPARRTSGQHRRASREAALLSAPGALLQQKRGSLYSERSDSGFSDCSVGSAPRAGRRYTTEASLPEQAEEEDAAASAAAAATAAAANHLCTVIPEHAPSVTLAPGQPPTARLEQASR